MSLTFQSPLCRRLTRVLPSGEGDSISEDFELGGGSLGIREEKEMLFPWCTGRVCPNHQPTRGPWGKGQHWPSHVDSRAGIKASWLCSGQERHSQEQKFKFRPSFIYLSIVEGFGLGEQGTVHLISLQAPSTVKLVRQTSRGKMRQSSGISLRKSIQRKLRRLTKLIRLPFS